MRILRVKICSLILLSSCLIGCSTSSYRILSQDRDAAELEVTPDRILLECEWIRDGDWPDMYGFMIHILDDENTTLTLAQGNVLGREDCDRRIRIISRIMREGKAIYIAGIGDITELRKKGRLYSFPKKGAFPSNGRTLSFVAVANEHDSCYDAYSGEEKPCPREPFPKVRRSKR